MKYTIRQIKEGEDEVILQYKQMNPEVERLLKFFGTDGQRIVAFREKTQVILEPHNILYIESVDGKTFAYTKEQVLRVDYPLNRLEKILTDINFFRCSKSMILNIDKVDCLRSLPSNRIDAQMCNGEHIIISRTYASDFRKRLKGGAKDEET